MNSAFKYDTISAAIYDQFCIHPNVTRDETEADKTLSNSNVSTHSNPSCTTTVNTTAASSSRHSRTGSSYCYTQQYETEIFEAFQSLSLTSNNNTSSSNFLINDSNNSIENDYNNNKNDNNSSVNYTCIPRKNRVKALSFTALPLLATKTDSPSETTPHTDNASNESTNNSVSNNKNIEYDEEMIDATTTDANADSLINDTLPLHHISTIHHQILQQENAEEELATLNKL